MNRDNVARRRRGTQTASGRMAVEDAVVFNLADLLSLSDAAA
jgi:hypothetical protein